jgi:hypothetical protein
LCEFVEKSNSVIYISITQKCDIKSKGSNNPSTAIGNIDVDAFLKAYPNPSQGKFILHTHNIGQGHIEIYNVMGELVFTTPLNARAATQIDLAGHAKGMYVVKMITSDKTYSSRLLLQ